MLSKNLGCIYTKSLNLIALNDLHFMRIVKIFPYQLIILTCYNNNIQKYYFYIFFRAAPQFRCTKIFQVQAPVNAVMLHPDQSQIMVGDQSGIIHMWDLSTDQNEQLVCIQLTLLNTSFSPAAFPA